MNALAGYSEKSASRFWSHVEKSASGCWEWQAYVNSQTGYGQFAVSHREGISAHRLAWMLVHGPIPKGNGYHGTCVLHRCDNRRCVNPAHLFLGSVADNQRDMVAKGRRRGGRRPRRDLPCVFPKRQSSGRPFAKGDARINRKGRPPRNTTSQTSETNPRSTK